MPLEEVNVDNGSHANVRNGSSTCRRYQQTVVVVELDAGKYPRVDARVGSSSLSTRRKAPGGAFERLLSATAQTFMDAIPMRMPRSRSWLTFHLRECRRPRRIAFSCVAS